MALSTAVKTTLDGMSNVDKALTTLYVVGVDKTETAIALGKACVRHGWPDLDPDALTNEELALAILKTIQRQLRHVWVTSDTPPAEETARSAARAAVKVIVDAALVEDNPLAAMPTAEP